MLKLFYEGGPLFMGILSLILIYILIVLGISIRKIHRNQFELHTLEVIKSTGLLAGLIGLLGQIIGLYAGFDVAEAEETISSQVIFGGLKISLITTAYGLIIWIISRLVVLTLSWYHRVNFVDIPKP